VEELADASALRDDPAALRRRLAEDGYLFFRGLLPAAEVGAAADSVLAALRQGGSVTGSGIASAGRRALDFREALGDPAFRAAIASPAFNRIPYLAQLRRLIRMILGPQAFSYPVKVLRAVYPERPPAVARGRYVHQDYAVTGVQDMLTTWVPLMKIPAGLGGWRYAREVIWGRRSGPGCQNVPYLVIRRGPAALPLAEAGPSAMVGGGPGHQPAPAGVPGRRAARPVTVFRGPPRLAALAAAQPAGPLALSAARAA
jgi:hypothetical protein